MKKEKTLNHFSKNNNLDNEKKNSHNKNTNLLISNLFKELDSTKRGFITSSELWSKVQLSGVKSDDPRFLRVHEKINSITQRLESDKKIDEKDFFEILLENNLILKALTNDFLITDFNDLCHDIEDIYTKTKSINKGKVARYIPQLARVNPDYYAVSICTIDGQRFSAGDAKINFCLQSTSKPLNYCLVHEELGEEKVHSYVGREPSGMVFNELSLNSKGLPHNPLINAGAIMCCSLMQREMDIADKFEYVTNYWKEASGGTKPSFNNSVYLSERQTADRNFALAYFMRENKAFPPKTNIVETLEFYFQCCSMELNTEAMSVVAATLANGGICPITDKKVFHSKTVQNCLSLMYSCGLYDFSGEFAFTIGLPAKSGVAGALMVVIPQIMGICIWSPRLDKHGNSVKGVEFCRELVKRYNFHNYDLLTSESGKKDLRQNKNTNSENIYSLILAASNGDLEEVKRLESLGMNLSVKDYDGRTALHLAVSENRTEIVKYLISKSVDINTRDRWNNTPLSDAKRLENNELIKLLVENGAN